MEKTIAPIITMEPSAKITIKPMFPSMIKQVISKFSSQDEHEFNSELLNNYK